MAWNLPAAAVAFTIATVAGWADPVRDCLEYLKGLAGLVTIEDDMTVTGDVTVDNLITAGLVDGRDVSADGTLLDAHKARHEPAGADEINDIDIANTGVLLSAHAARHENAGADEISVLGLSGLLADGQTPIGHSASHENAGGDEISVLGLSGLLADDQNPVVHGAAEHTDQFRHFQVPFLAGTGALVGVGKFQGYQLNGAGQWCSATFQIPFGFTGFSGAYVAIIPVTTGDFDWTVDSEQLDNGEVIGTDTDTDTANAQAATNLTLLELTVSNALNALTLAVGDWVGVEFTLDALNTTTAVVLIGLFISYAADE